MKNRIKELRKLRGLTISQLAEKVNLSNTHISNIENHKRGLEISWLEPFAKALAVSPIDLLEGDWNMKLINSNSNNLAISQNGNATLTTHAAQDKFELEVIELFRKMNMVQKAKTVLSMNKIMEEDNTLEEI